MSIIFKPFLTFLAFSSFLFTINSANILASPGDLDTAFGNNGLVLTDFMNGSQERGYAVAVQPDGRLIIAGKTEGDIIAARYNSDGTLDLSFGGGDGIVTTDTGGNSDVAYAVAVQANGKILVAGDDGINGDFIIVRYLADGTLDNGFSGGVVRTNMGGADYIKALALQPDGKIIAAGRSKYVNSFFAVARYNIDGSLDLTFGAPSPNDPNQRTGKQLIDFASGNNDEGGESVALQSDGKILIGGNAPRSGTDNDFALTRLNGDGTPDLTFNSAGASPGKVFTDFTGNADSAYGIAVQPDGKIVLAGQSSNSATSIDFGVARYNTDGTLDMGFNQSGNVPGTVQINIGNGNTDEDYGRAVQIQPNGKILVAGSAGFIPNGEGFGLIRLNANGSLDANFGNGGKVVTDPGRGIAHAMTIQSDGKLIVAGTLALHTTTTGLDLGLARYESDSFAGSYAPVPRDFDGDGVIDLAVYAPDSGYWYISQSSGFVASVQLGGPSFVPVPRNYDGDGKIDVAVYNPSNGLWKIINSSTGLTNSIAYGLPGDVPVSRNYDGDAKSDIAVYRPSNGVWDYIRSSDQTFANQVLGSSIETPVPFDYDNDGKVDFAVFNQRTGAWKILKSSTSTLRIETLGVAGDQPVPADYDGDGIVDLAVFRPADRNWHINRSQSGYVSQQWGQPGDIPVPARYDSDAKTDIAVYRPSNNTWRIARSSDNGFTLITFPNY